MRYVGLREPGGAFRVQVNYNYCLVPEFQHLELSPLEKGVDNSNVERFKQNQMEYGQVQTCCKLS